MRESIHEVQSSNFEITTGNNSERYYEDRRDYNLRHNREFSLTNSYRKIRSKYVTLQFRHMMEFYFQTCIICST